ncbi:MAG: hypothetical protein ACK56F_22715 [bacterium]
MEASGVQFIKKNIGTNNAKCLSVLLSTLLFNKNYELNSVVESTIVDNYFKNNIGMKVHNGGAITARCEINEIGSTH